MKVLIEKDFKGHSPLYVAKYYQQKKIEEFLISKGAELNDVDKENLNVFNAIEAGDMESLEIIINEDIEKNFIFKTKLVDVSKKILSQKEEKYLEQRKLLKFFENEDEEEELFD